MTAIGRRPAITSGTYRLHIGHLLVQSLTRSRLCPTVQQLPNRTDRSAAPCGALSAHR
ncbi:hypothetical protein [Kibdelosporangium philippinense]|uniref:hypothetical protein n=1 Tax=Kibdelosporangium philippinense TaxID=211113 RepID=UPI0036114F82